MSEYKRWLSYASLGAAGAAAYMTYYSFQQDKPIPAMLYSFAFGSLVALTVQLRRSGLEGRVVEDKQ